VTRLLDLAIAARAYGRTRWLARRLHTRADVEAYQLKRIRRYLRDVLPGFEFYRHLGDVQSLADLPTVGKAAMLDCFASFNRPGVGAADIRRALAEGRERIGDNIVGQSTGTSGNRGYYVISDAERFVWLGTLLAKALPDALWRRHKVALAMPGFSSLYRSAVTGSRLSLRFFDLNRGIHAWEDELSDFAPDVIVAPPKVLRHLAERERLHAKHIFSGAEVLDPIDRRVIEQSSGRTVREIYMATEGLFGVACADGTLHLAEDCVHFEWIPVIGSDLVSPLVSDFTRTTQAMLRYRMNDLLKLSDKPCACGSALQPVARIEGRMDDVLLLPASSGELRAVTPDVLRNAVCDADARIVDFRLVQRSADHIEVALEASQLPEFAPRVGQKLEDLFDAMGLSTITVNFIPLPPVPYDRKLRRVRRELSPQR
jgi:putative adenylate-forming enzyme